MCQALRLMLRGYGVILRMALRRLGSLAIRIPLLVDTPRALAILLSALAMLVAALANLLTTLPTLVAALAILLAALAFLLAALAFLLAALAILLATVAFRLAALTFLLAALAFLLAALAFLLAALAFLLATLAKSPRLQTTVFADLRTATQVMQRWNLVQASLGMLSRPRAWRTTSCLRACLPWRIQGLAVR